MTKSFDNAKVLCLNVELELKSEKENAEVRISDPDDYQSIVDAEWKIIYDKLALCVECGANVVLSKLFDLIFKIKNCLISLFFMSEICA